MAAAVDLNTCARTRPLGFNQWIYFPQPIKLLICMLLLHNAWCANAINFHGKVLMYRHTLSLIYMSECSVRASCLQLRLWGTCKKCSAQWRPLCLWELPSTQSRNLLERCGMRCQQSRSSLTSRHSRQNSLFWTRYVGDHSLNLNELQQKNGGVIAGTCQALF